MDLYHRPASLFVAEFIGSPKMNILPGKMLKSEAGMAEVEVAGQYIKVAVDARHVAPGSPISLGVRPENLHLGEHGEGAGLSVKVRHVERLGDISLLYVDYQAPDARQITVRVEGSVRPAAGTAITLRLLPEHLHLFDSAGVACTRTVELPT
jgi:multiple sugar transport system ATP-binding protein